MDQLIRSHLYHNALLHDMPGNEKLHYGNNMPRWLYAYLDGIF